METNLSYCGGSNAFFSSDSKKWIGHIRTLAAKNPDEVKIIKQPEENDGCIYAEVPVEYFKLTPKRRHVMTEEQMERAKERGRKLAELHTKKNKGE